MANSKYFKLNIIDITDKVLEACVSKNAFEFKRSSDGKKAIVEFLDDSIPASILQKGYTPIDKDILREEIESENWSEQQPVIDNSIPKDPNGFPVMAPTFEDAQGLTTVWKGYLYTAEPNSLNIYDELVTTQLKLRGGWYKLLDDTANIGDYIEFSVIDKDDTLGLFSMFGLTVGEDILELKKFVRTEYVNPASFERQDFQSGGASEVMQGLYFRTYYFNSGDNPVKFTVTEKYHEA